MLRFIKQLFGQNQIPEQPAVPDDFPVYAARAIQLLTTSDGQLEDAQVLDLFEGAGIPHREAVELLLFLPPTFCRHMLPRVKWPDYYWEYIEEGKRIKRLYADNKRFGIIQDALRAYLTEVFTQSDYLKIAGRSAAYRAINRLLLDNPGYKAEDVMLTPEHITY